MIQRKKTEHSIIKIDLDGPNGNAHKLIGTAMNLAKQLDLDPQKITDEMMLGDYTNLVKTFDKYFGHVVTLETTNEEILDNLK